MGTANLFIDRESGVTSRVEHVNDHGARITVMTKLTSSWFMPLSEYDTVFVKRFVPLDVGQMQSPEGFRPPANASYWDEEKAAANPPEPALDASRGEGEEGVVIGSGGNAPG